MSRKISMMAAGAAALLTIGAFGVANAAVASPAAAPAWQSVGPAKVSGTVSAVTAVRHGGKTYEYAFVTPAYEDLKGQMTLYSRVGSGAWAKRTIPSKSGEAVVSAAALSPTDVLAFTQYSDGGRVLRFNGKSWSVFKTFNDAIGAATVLAANDIWVYGNENIAYTGPLGVYHYNGRTWTKVASGLDGGTATSATNAWAFTGTTVARYNGKKWTTTNLAKLLPAKSRSTDPLLTDVVATSNSTAYAIGNGNTELTGGPVVVLKFNGKSWTKVAQYRSGYTVQQQDIASDGHDGLWIPAESTGAPAFLLHFSGSSHAITKTSVPGAAGKTTSYVFSIVNIPGTTEELAGGDYNNGPRNPPFYALALFYN